MRVRATILGLFLSAAAVAAGDFTTLKGHGGPIMDIAVAPEGVVVSASFDNSLGLWDGRKPTWLEAHDAAVTSVFAGPGAQLVSGSDDFTVRIWHQGKARVLGRHKGKVSDVALSPDGALAASASWDGTIGLWSLDGGPSKMLNSPKGGVNAIAFSADGRTLFAATNSGAILAYDLVTDGAPRRLADHGFGVNRLIVQSDWLAYGAVDGTTRVIDVSDGARRADFTLDRRPILSMAYHAASAQLAVGDGHGYIMMLDTEHWTISRDFRATRSGPVWALAFSRDGSTLYAGGLDDVVYAWPIEALDVYEPVMAGERSFQKPTATMPNGERQFMRKCSICHALEAGNSRKAGPSLHGVFGRRAGTVPSYSYSPILAGSDIIWSEVTIDALFDLGPDHYIPGSKMPMQRITAQHDRDDLIAFLKSATAPGEKTE